MKNQILIIFFLIHSVSAFGQKKDTTSNYLGTWKIDTVNLGIVEVRGTALNTTRRGPVVVDKTKKSIQYCLDLDTCNCCWKEKIEGKSIIIKGELLNIFTENLDTVGIYSYQSAKLVFINFDIKYRDDKKLFIKSENHPCYSERHFGD